MATPPVPELLRAHLNQLALDDQRLDGRSRFEGRNVVVETVPEMCILKLYPTN